jgi:hypothetical protein
MPHSPATPTSLAQYCPDAYSNVEAATRNAINKGLEATAARLSAGSPNTRTAGGATTVKTPEPIAAAVPRTSSGPGKLETSELRATMVAQEAAGLASVAARLEREYSGAKRIHTRGEAPADVAIPAAPTEPCPPSSQPAADGGDPIEYSVPLDGNTAAVLAAPVDGEITMGTSWAYVKTA